MIKEGTWDDSHLCKRELSQGNLQFKKKTLNYKVPYLHHKQEYYYQGYQYAQRYNFKNSMKRYICIAYTLGLTHKQISDMIKSVHARTGIWKPISRSTVQRTVASFNQKLRLFLDSQNRGLQDIKNKA